MSIPPVEKLALAVRKNLRDEFENKKAGLEERLSTVQGVPWTIAVNPLATFAYAKDDYAKENHGGMLYAYFDAAIDRIARAKGSKDDLNALAPAHVLALEIVPGLAAPYATCAVADGGKLVIQVNSNALGVNMEDAVSTAKLEKALNEASSASDTAVPLAVEKSLAGSWKEHEAGYAAKVAEILGKPVRLNPRVAENVAAFKAEAASGGSHSGGKIKAGEWEDSFGDALDAYFKAFVFQLGAQKFAGDEMLQEGFFEAVDKAEVAFRIVDKLTRRSYNEAVVEDGVLYLQTTFADWYVNTEEMGKGLVDLL